MFRYKCTIFREKKCHSKINYQLLAVICRFLVLIIGIWLQNWRFGLPEGGKLVSKHVEYTSLLFTYYEH
jgi:hypothetical protein